MSKTYEVSGYDLKLHGSGTADVTRKAKGAKTFFIKDIRSFLQEAMTAVVDFDRGPRMFSSEQLEAIMVETGYSSDCQEINNLRNMRKPKE